MSTTHGFSRDRLQRIAPALERFVAREAITGFALSVSRHGETVLTAAVGEADREDHRDVEADTIFQIMSMTKPITAVAAMILYEEGHFTLNTPVSDFIPGFADVGVVPAGWDQPDAPPADQLDPLLRPITMRHLFTHTAGLSYGWKSDDPVDRAYHAAFDMEKDRFWDEPLSLWIDRVATLPIAFQPGTKWRYSIAIDVIGRIVEIISGMELDAFFRERLFDPLGMDATDFSVPPEKMDRLANVYQHEDKDSPLTLMMRSRDSKRDKRPRLYMGGGGLVSTLGDYTRFANMLACGGALDRVRILSPQTVRLFSVNQMSGQAMPYGFADGEDLSHWGYGYSLGTRVLVDLAKSGQAGSVGEFGWDGAFNTYFWVDPAMELTGVFMTQHMPNNFDPMADTFKALVYAALEE